MRAASSMLCVTSSTVEPVSRAVVEDVLDYALAAAGVEAGRGLVEYEHPRAHGDDAGDGYAALLAAGELERAALEELLAYADEARRLAHALVYLASESFMFFGPKAMSLYTVSSKSWYSGYWNTSPTLKRTSRVASLVAKMSCPSQ